MHPKLVQPKPPLTPGTRFPGILHCKNRIGPRCRLLLALLTSAFACDRAAAVIAFRAATSNNSGSVAATSITINKPAGLAEGDFMLAAISMASNQTVTVPTGWTLVRAVTDGFRTNIYKKTAGASEPASYTWSYGAAIKLAGGIVAFSGVDAVNPIQIENGVGEGTTVTAVHTTPTIATTGATTWLVSIFGDRTGTGSTWSPPSGTTERVDTHCTGSTATSVAIYTQGPVAAGNQSHTATASVASDVAAMEIVALNSGPPPLPSTLINASSYGAVGNGIADDTTALQNALDAAANNPGTPGTVVLDVGSTYLITTDLHATNSSGFAIDGQGKTIKVANGTLVSHYSLNITNCQNWAIVRLTVDGNRANRTGTGQNPSIRVAGGSGFYFYQVTSTNSPFEGFYLTWTTKTSDPTAYPTNGYFDQCTATNAERNGLGITVCRNVKVYGGSYNGSNGEKPNAGIDLEPNDLSGSPPPTYVGVENVLISGVTAQDNWGAGIKLAGPGPSIVRYVTVENCTVTHNCLSTFGGTSRAAGINVASQNCLIQNNSVSQHGTTVYRGVIDFDSNSNGANNVVKNNSIFDNTTTTGAVVIASNTGTNNQVSNNTLTNNASGIVNNNPGSCVAGNIIDGVNQGGTPCTEPSPLGNQIP